MRVNDLVKFIKARENARHAHDGEAHVPLDPIIKKYRFCNVHREDDKVTKWLRDVYYPMFGFDQDVWFAAVAARLLNLPESLAAVQSYILPWKPEKFRAMLHKRRDNGKKNFNAAYIVSTNGVAMDKVDYVTYNILGQLWAERRNMRPKRGDTLEVYHNMLMQFDGLGSFIAAQVIADLKYIPQCPLSEAVDWYSFAASGPGSRRGLNRVMGYDVGSSYSESTWRCDLALLRSAVNKKLSDPLHAQDLQNCLCEFDKYERARLGEGTPKQLYRRSDDG